MKSRLLVDQSFCDIPGGPEEAVLILPGERQNKGPSSKLPGQKTQNQTSSLGRFRPTSAPKPFPKTGARIRQTQHSLSAGQERLPDAAVFNWSDGTAHITLDGTKHTTSRLRPADDVISKASKVVAVFEVNGKDVEAFVASIWWDVCCQWSMPSSTPVYRLWKGKHRGQPKRKTKSVSSRSFKMGLITNAANKDSFRDCNNCRSFFAFPRPVSGPQTLWGNSRKSRECPRKPTGEGGGGWGRGGLETCFLYPSFGPESAGKPSGR